MISKAMLVSALLVMTVSIGVAHADDDDWVGFYTAIDALDGSVDHLSIVQNSDGTYDIRMTSSALALCTPDQTAGWIVATGRLVGGNLVRENVMFGCVGTDGMTPMADGTYTRDHETEILTIEGPLDRLNHYHPVHDD